MNREHVGEYNQANDHRAEIGSLGVVACVIAAAAIMLPGGGETSKTEEKATEACVGKIVGHTVDLQRYADGEHEGLTIAPSVEDEQRACMRNGNDVVAARADLATP